MFRKILIFLVILILPIYLLQNILLDNFHTVIKNKIYRSAQPNSVELRYYIKKYHIKTIINLRGENKNKLWYQKEIVVSDKYNVKHYDIALSSHKLPTNFQLRKLVKLLQKAPKPILINCAGGADRTGLASAISLILNNDKSTEDQEDQASWKYNVVSSDSVGYLVLKNYYAWLNKYNKTNNKIHFLEWTNSKLKLKYYTGLFL